MSLNQVMGAVNELHSTKLVEPDIFESDLQKWKRWEWYMSSHLGSEGEFVDIGKKLWKATKATRSEKETNRSIHSSWTSIGPNDSPLAHPDASFNGIGRVSRIAFHPSNPSTIYVGAPFGGLWKTLNEGTTWSNLTDHLPSLSVTGIVISHANPNHIYILTGDGDGDYNSTIAINGYTGVSVGVLKSLDGGASWHETGPFSSLAIGYQLIQDPNNADVLLAATSVGLYRTINGGDSWSLRKSGRCYDVEFKPGNSDTVYLAQNGEFWSSSNNGHFWGNGAQFDLPIVNGGRMQLAVSQNSLSTVYILSGPSDTAEFKGLWKSTNSGLNFVRQSNTPNVLGKLDDGSDAGHASGYNLCIAAASNNANKIVVGALSTWRSVNSGINWINSTSYSEDGSFAYIHPDIHDLKYNPLNHKLYAASDGGLYVSSDHGITWEDLSVGIRTTMFFHMRSWNGSSPKLMAGCQDNGVKYRRDATTTWYHINQADGFDAVFNPLSGEPGYGTANRSVQRYSDDGNSSTSITPPGDSVWFKTVAVHNTRPDTVILGSFNIRVSYNGGDAWTDAGSSGSWAMASCPSNNSKFYAAGGNEPGAGDETNSGAYVSTDIGQSWTNISVNPGFPSSWTKITDIVPNPVNSNMVYVTLGGMGSNEKVYRSTTSGSAWTNITDNLPDVAVYCIGVDSDNSLYLGTDIGIFYRNLLMSEWMLWSNGLPNTPVVDIAVQNSFVRCATMGRGAFQSLKANGCSESLVLVGALAGNQQYETSDFITSTSAITSGLGTFISFGAGDKVDLKTGFEVANSSKFLAYTGPCGTGGIPSIWYPGNEQENSVRANGGEIESNIKHTFPLGSIDHVQRGVSHFRIDFTVRSKGTINFIFLKDGNKIPLHNETFEKGAASVQIETGNIHPGFYYLVMYNDSRVAHFQEYEIE
jgi:hypothetical protein